MAHKVITFLFLILWCAGPLSGQTEPLYLVGGTIITMTGENLENGLIRIENGKITYIGRRLSIPNTAMQLDTRGKYITPGFILAHCRLGVPPEDAADSSLGKITPGYRVLDQIDLEDPGFREASLHGVTTANVMPYSRRPMPGVGLLIKTSGQGFEDRVISDHSALSIFLEKGTVASSAPQERSLASEVEVILQIRNSFRRALELKRARESLENNVSALDITENTEVLIQALNQEIPVMIYAGTPTEIERGISLNEDFELKPIFVNMRGMAQLWDRLQGEVENIIPGPVATTGPTEWLRPIDQLLVPEVIARHFRTQILVNDFGLEGTGGVRDVVYQAAQLQRWGVSPREALETLTVNPATMLGVADRIGTLEVGKDADLNIWSDPPLSMQSLPDIVIVNGEIVTEAQR